MAVSKFIRRLETCRTGAPISRPRRMKYWFQVPGSGSATLKVSPAASRARQRSKNGVREIIVEG